MKKIKRKIIAVSDSHGSSLNLIKLFKLHPDADCFIHLGDGAREFDSLCRRNSVIGYSMLGNCDMPFACPRAESPHSVYTIGEKRFFMTHGHLYSVKSSRDVLISRAREICPEVDIILYGHTHVAENRYISPESENDKGIYLINPGSISLPRDTRTPSYALIVIEGSDMITNIATIS